MKFTRFSLLAVGLFSISALVGVAQAQPTIPGPIDTGMPKPADAPDRQELSLALGTFFARYDTNYLFQNFAMDEKEDLDLGKVVEGFSNFMAGPDKAMPWMQVTNILNRQVAFLKEKAVVDSNAMVAAGPETKAKGLKFLEDNAALPGVTRLTNGVEYKVVKEGDGVMPGANDLVTVTLTARLIDGSAIGSLSNRELSLSNLRPLPPSLGQVLTTMKAGSHWLIYVPYDLAYGDKPAIASALRAPKVPPYSVVIFDVELEAVRPPTQPAAAPPMGRGGPPMSGAPGPAQPPIMHPPAIPTMPPAGTTPPQTSSDIVRVPSADELKRGSNIEVMTLDQAIKRSQTNSPNNP